MTRRRILGPVLLVLPIACSSGSAKREKAAQDSALAAGAVVDTTAVGIKACDLLSAEDFKRVTGLELSPGVTTNDYMGVSQCRFDKPGDVTGGAIVALHTDGNLSRYRRVPGSAPVAGVGDSAVWNDRTAQLAVQRHAAVFSISFFSPAAKKEWALALAKPALVKMAKEH